MKSSNAVEKTQRVLICIPIVHTQEDMGAMGESVQAAGVRKMGRQKWKHNLRQVDQIWDKIEEAVESLRFEGKIVRVYQDGLPVCGKEEDIVARLAESGSRNHQLLMRLKARGAVIMGTESPPLLIEEYGLMKQLLSTGGSRELAKPDVRQQALGASLLERRDQSIAQRINETLGPSETGILFIGLLHSIERFLDPTMEVVYLLGRPKSSMGGKNERAHWTNFGS